MPESAKRNGYSSFPKHESSRALYSVYLRSSKSKSANYNVCPRSVIVNARKRKTQWIFFVLKAWEPIRALRCRPFRLHLLSRGYFADSQTSSAERKLERKITRQQVIYANRRYFMISVTQLHRALFME